MEISRSNLLLKHEIQKRLKEAHIQAMKTTANAINTVIYNKATDETKTAEERLEDIIKFCKVTIDKK